MTGPQLSATAALSAGGTYARARADIVLAVVAYDSHDDTTAARWAPDALATGSSESRSLAEAITGYTEIDSGAAHESAGEGMLRQAVRDQPLAFMDWHALSRLDVRCGDLPQAVQDDRQALLSYELGTSQGLGQFAVIMSSQTGQGYTWIGGGALNNLTADLDTDVQSLTGSQTP